jgi:hypothetical protein
MAKETENKEIDKINKEIRDLEKKRSLIWQKQREKEEKERKDAYMKENKKGIEYLQQFVGKPCVFGKNPITHFYWDPFNDGHPIEYDYIYVMLVDHISYRNTMDVAISGRGICTSDNYVHFDEHFQRNFTLAYLMGTHKPTDHEEYNGGLRILSDKELKEVLKFARTYSEDFLTKIVEAKPKTNFHFDSDDDRLTEKEKKEIEDEIKLLKSYDESISIAYKKFKQAEAEFNKAIFGMEHNRFSFSVQSKFVESVNGFSRL